MIRSILPLLTIPVGGGIPSADPRSYVRVRCVGGPMGVFEATLMVRLGASMPECASLRDDHFRYAGRGAGRQHIYEWFQS